MSNAQVPGTSYLVARAGGKLLALVLTDVIEAVDEVLGVRALAGDDLAALPPLFQGLAAGLAEAVAAVDEQLLLLLRSGRLVPDEAWRAMAGEGRE